MSNAGLSYGLNIKKKPTGNRPQPGKRKPIFDEPDSDGEENGTEEGIEEIGEIGGLSKPSNSKRNPLSKPSGPPSKNGNGTGGPKKAPISMYGDLSSAFTSKKHADTAEELDPSIYDYDGVYDSLKPKKKPVEQEQDSKPKYMTHLIAAAAVRKRDATIAEEKKLAREREAEGEEFKDKEKFVTSAYKKQQEENRRIEEEEERREEEEREKNKGKGMLGFYKNMLEKDEQQHQEMMKAAEEAAKRGPAEKKADEESEKSEVELAREISEKTGQKIAVNDEGQVVDRTQLLKGGLNVKPKPKNTAPANASRSGSSVADRSKAPGFVGAGGSKQAMRERQSRMMEAQLEAASKRAFEAEEEEQEKIERASKSRKTEGEIMSAKERYLARKREAEEAKKRGEVP